MRTLEIYEQIQEWELLLNCLNRNKDTFGDAERLSLINRYVPNALNSIYKTYYGAQNQPALDLKD